jgi:MFS family permease
MALLGDRAFLRGLGAAFSFQFGNVSFYLAVTLFMQADLGLSPLRSGLAVVPLALAFTLASQLAGLWMARGGIGVLLRGSAVQLAGIVVLGGPAALVPQPGTAALAAALVVFGFGQGLVMAPLAGVVLAAVRPGFAGSGAGLLNTVQQAAAAVGVSAVGAVYFWGGAEDRLGILAALALLAASVAATAGLLARMRRAREGAAGRPCARAKMRRHPGRG